MRAYRNLKVWSKSMDMVDDIYKASALFPKDETYGLRCQIRRSAVSVPSNAEMETQLEIAQRQNYLTKDMCNVIFNLSAEVGKMLNGLATSLEAKLPTANCNLQTLQEA